MAFIVDEDLNEKICSKSDGSLVRHKIFIVEYYDAYGNDQALRAYSDEEFAYRFATEFRKTLDEDAAVRVKECDLWDLVER